MLHGHMHICPHDIIIFQMIMDVVPTYYYHYKHIITSYFTNLKDKKCKVCNEQD